MKNAGENPFSLSKKLGISHSTIGRWLKGSEPEARQIAPIALALSVDAHWLLAGNGPPRTSESALTTNYDAMIAEAPEETETLSTASPRTAATLMSEDELRATIAEWAAMLTGKTAFMQTVILGNLAVLINELNGRLTERRNVEVHYGTQRTKETP